MPAREPYDLIVEQGSTFSWVGVLASMDEATLATAPINLTGVAARMQVRRRTSDAAPLVELTSENGRVYLGAQTGTVTLALTASETAALPAGRHVYDLELVEGTAVSRLMGGAFVVSAEVTR